MELIGGVPGDEGSEKYRSRVPDFVFFSPFFFSSRKKNHATSDFEL